MTARPLSGRAASAPNFLLVRVLVAARGLRA